MNEKNQEFIDQGIRKHKEKVFLIEQGLGAEVHWFFTQAQQALESELYLPACTSFINGIEASIRVTLSQIKIPTRVKELDPIKTLSNRLLKNAQDAGIPIECLAFPNEQGFMHKLRTEKPNKVNVEIVKVRHNLCHGNILEYINTELGERNEFFTPECCRELAFVLYAASKQWAKNLGAFRRSLFEA